MKAGEETDQSNITNKERGGEGEGKEIHPKVGCSLGWILLTHQCVGQLWETTSERVFKKKCFMEI